MRRGLMAVAGLVALAACRQEPTFEERYDKASETIRQRAKSIDAQISATGAPASSAPAVKVELEDGGAL
ncbi:MAG: hypothetical protein K0R64_2752 [Novosphingobium lindaniclasticum]|uniref:hypothetical protein n=1 Tax=Novosphingobium lindaniclasticum TaxID=1329895 RepID=UPI00240A55C6|nr:hypothetical protein [Novosphingobium lindaniclasticum]MDF2639768.1 hypothetical protein [Novosphingobium lindaniclasticum]